MSAPVFVNLLYALIFYLFGDVARNGVVMVSAVIPPGKDRVFGGVDNKGVVEKMGSGPSKGRCSFPIRWFTPGYGRLLRYVVVNRP